MKKYIFITLTFFVFFLNISTLEAQTITEKPDWHFFSKALIPEPSSEVPDWVKPLYSTEVNIEAVELAMLDYYTAKGGFKRDTYSRFFQRWADAATPYIDEKGNVRNWNTAELVEAQSNPKIVHNSNTKSAGNWSFLGPEETYWRADDSNSGPANWQVNVYSFAIAPSNPNILYAGTETGGFFKTSDKGLNWTFVAKDYNFGANQQSISVHPTDPNTILVGTNSNILKSTDGGTTWSIVYTQSGLTCTDLEYHPTNPNRIFASTEKGLFRSDNGGATWGLILTQEFYDLEFQPSNPNQIYALGHDTATNQFVLYKSTNGGLGFNQSMSGWGTIYERSGGKLALSAADANYVYAILLTDDNTGGNEKPYLQKSTDGGTSWTTAATGTTTAFEMNNGQGYYDLSILASPTNAEHIIVGTQQIYRSTNGGTSFTNLTSFGNTPIMLHPDIQDSKCIGGDCWISTDGGMAYSTDFFDNPTNYSIRNKGIAGSHFWGYSQGWNEDMFVGGRYHNGNTAWHENYPTGQTLRMGGAESATGWILYGRNRKAYFDDIGGYTIPMAINDAPAQDFAFTKHPNKVYGRTTSRLLNHPENAAIYFTGEGNDFWKSVDAGISWTSLNNFGEQVWWFEISRSNPDVIYTFTNSGFHKTTDGGATWSNMTSMLPGGWGSYNRGRVTVDGRDENTLWIVRYNGGNGGKVYKSTNGGASWSNWTTTTLNGRNFSCLVHALGTDGGVYLASTRGNNGIASKVFYRNNSASDWTDCSSNFPAGMDALKAVPFYRDSKIRVAGTLSLWEMDLIEMPNIIAQPMIAAESELKCGQDIPFDCYSVLDHAGATWSWAFPSAVYVSSTTVRNPMVRYDSPGNYTATLTITRGVEMDSKTIDVVVGTGGTCVNGMVIDPSNDSDNDGINDFLESTICDNALAQSTAVYGNNAVVETFDFGRSIGVFYVELNAFTNCYNTTATLKAFVDLDNQAIQVISYDHFDTAPNDITGDGTTTITSTSTSYAQVRFQLSGMQMQVIQVSNACGDGAFMRLDASCWSSLDVDGDGQLNLLDTDSDADGIDDTTETTACDNALAQTAWVSGSNAVVETFDFGAATTGLFYIELNAFTNCYNTTATLKAFVDLDNQEIHVVSYDHFSTASDIFLGNTTNTITSESGSYAKVQFQLSGNQMQVIQVDNACGSVMRLNASCWSALDSDADGINEFLDYLPVLISVKVMLQGAYNSTGGMMDTDLGTNNLIPLTQPYTATYIGTESVTSIPADVVDWVLIELRQPANTVVSKRAGFLKKDGAIVDLDGSSSVRFDVPAGNYFVAVRHRNHLGIMLQNEVTLTK